MAVELVVYYNTMWCTNHNSIALEADVPADPASS